MLAFSKTISSDPLQSLLTLLMEAQALSLIFRDTLTQGKKSPLSLHHLLASHLSAFAPTSPCGPPLPAVSLLPATDEWKPGEGKTVWDWYLSLQGNLGKSPLPPEPISSSSPPHPIPFLFSLTLVTDDKASFPAKPINKLNRQKMSI